MKNPALVSVQSWVQCRRPDPKSNERLTHIDSRFVVQQCSIHTQGCTDPALPNTQVAVIYTLPDGTKDVRYVPMDENGCYIDIVTAADPGRWQTEVVIEGDDCREAASSPPQDADVPPTLCGGATWCCWLWLGFLIALIAALLWCAHWRCDMRMALRLFLIAATVALAFLWLLLTYCQVNLCWLLLSIALAVIVVVVLICFTSIALCICQRRTKGGG